MSSFLHFTLASLGRFERWFDVRFGWFFTNGMKERAPHPDRSLKA